jgi:hypothetical protein
MNEDKFVYDMDDAPWFFFRQTDQQRAAFSIKFNAHVREYYKKVRTTQMHHTTPLSKKHPMTCGEIALIHLKQKHNK